MEETITQVISKKARATLIMIINHKEKITSTLVVIVIEATIIMLVIVSSNKMQGLMVPDYSGNLNNINMMINSTIKKRAEIIITNLPLRAIIIPITINLSVKVILVIMAAKLTKMKIGISKIRR